MPTLNDLVYTDSSRFELGVLHSYELDIDVAKEKDFELRTREFPSDNDGNLAIDCGSFITLDDTEYGGRIDSASHNDDDDDEMVYTGRTWRGILNSKYIYSSAPRAVVAYGTLQEEINRRLSEAQLGGTDAQYEFPDGVDSNGSSVKRVEKSLFICDEPGIRTIGTLRTGDRNTSGDVNMIVTGFVYPSQCTVYDGIIMLAREKNYKLTFRYDLSDKKVHITPNTIDDYTEYLEYTGSNSAKLSIKNADGAVNHIIAVGANEEGVRRLIHIFTDRNGTIQPYYVIPSGAQYTEPIKESEYITDTRNQVLYGLDEIVKIYNGNITAHENFEVMEGSPPADWSSLYNTTYVKKEETDNNGIWTGSYVYEPTQPLEETRYELLTEKPVNWDSDDPNVYGRYSDYFEDISSTVTNDLNNNGHIDENEHTYGNVSGETVLHGLLTHKTEADIWNDPTWCGSYELLKRKPDDWDATYSEYYRREHNGNHYVFESVEGITIYNYIEVLNKPTNWDENYGSYFTKKENLGGEYTYYKRTKKGNVEISEAEYTFEYEEYKRHGRKKKFKNSFFKVIGFGSVQANEVKHIRYHVYYQRKKNGHWPSKWGTPKDSEKIYKNIAKTYKKHRSGNVYYSSSPKNAKKRWRLETVYWTEQKPPAWKKGMFYEQIATTYASTKTEDSWEPGNIYRKKTGEKKPEFETGKYYEQVSYNTPPAWESGKYYKLLRDYYKDLCDGAISELKQARATDSQSLTLDDFDLDVGDLVGCYDDRTGWSMSGVPVTNSVVKIESGLKTSCEYEVGGEVDLSIANASGNSVEVYYDVSVANFDDPSVFKLRVFEDDDYAYYSAEPTADVVYICINGYDPNSPGPDKTTNAIPYLGWQFYWDAGQGDQIGTAGYKAYK